MNNETMMTVEKANQIMDNTINEIMKMDSDIVSIASSAYQLMNKEASEANVSQLGECVKNLCLLQKSMQNAKKKQKMNQMALKEYFDAHQNRLEIFLAKYKVLTQMCDKKNVLINVTLGNCYNYINDFYKTNSLEQ